MGIFDMVDISQNDKEPAGCQVHEGTLHLLIQGRKLKGSFRIFFNCHQLQGKNPSQKPRKSKHHQEHKSNQEGSD